MTDQVHDPDQNGWNGSIKVFVGFRLGSVQDFQISEFQQVAMPMLTKLLTVINGRNS
jgi:hypothetical protein